jgi:AraC-like DNA-binding protein
VRRGLFTRTTGAGTLVADANHVLFYTRGEPYRISHPLPGGDTCTLIALDTRDLLEIVGRHAPDAAERETAPFDFTWTLGTPRTVLLHHLLLAGLRRGETTALGVEDLVFALVDDLLGHGYALARDRRRFRARAVGRRHDLVEAAKLALDRDAEHPPSLGDLARTLGCSPCHLSRTFHRETGLPLRRYLHRCRLRTAAERLADGERDLTTLALDLGYADHSHFTNAFRREFGLSPSSFRRRTRKNVQV